MSAQMKPETIVLHAGPRSDSSTGAVAVPIFQTTSYQFRSTEHAANLFALRDFGNIYSRIMNPTCDALEQKMAALGTTALALAADTEVDGKWRAGRFVQRCISIGTNGAIRKNVLARHLLRMTRAHRRGGGLVLHCCFVRESRGAG